MSRFSESRSDRHREHTAEEFREVPEISEGENNEKIWSW